MIFCESCRLIKKYPKHPAHPYVGTMLHGECEVCRRSGPVHVVPTNLLKSRKDMDVNEIVVDNIQQEVYRLKCDDLAVYFVRGPAAGRINDSVTKDLQQLFLHRDGEIDWVSTYELRLKVRDGYNQVEGKIKSIGG